jgi:hypothetical protein
LADWIQPCFVQGPALVFGPLHSADDAAWICVGRGRPRRVSWPRAQFSFFPCSEKISDKAVLGMFIPRKAGKQF